MEGGGNERKKKRKKEAQSASVSTEYTIKCKKKKKKKGSKEIPWNVQVQLRPSTRANKLPFVNARYCKSLNSLFASSPKKLKHWNNPIPRSSYSSSGFIQAPNLQSLTSWIVHMNRTGLLAAIMNLISNSWFCTQRQANASAEQLTREGGRC